MSIYKGKQLIAGGGVADAFTPSTLKGGTNVSITRAEKPEIDSNTLAVLHFDDSSDIAKNEISDGIVLTPRENCYEVDSSFKFGQSSIIFNNSGASGWLANDDGISNSDFSVDFWTKFNSSSSRVSICNSSNSDAPWGRGFILYNDNITLANADGASTINGTEVTLDESIVIGTWNHVAYVQEGLDYRIYLNGNKVANGTYSQLISLNDLLIWGWGSAVIDELRVSDCVRYSGDTITVWDQPYGKAGTTPDIYKINANIETNIIRTSDIEQSNILPMIPGNLDSIRKAGIYSIILSVDQQGFTVELPYRLDVVSYSYMGASMACMQYLSTKILNSNITLQRSDEGDGQGFGSWKVSELPPSSEYYSGITGTTLNISSICDYEDLIHPSMISVYKNGAKLYPDGLDVISSDIQYDYSITGKTITFHTPLIPSDLIEVRYS